MSSVIQAYSVGDPIDVRVEGLYCPRNARPTGVFMIFDPEDYLLLARKPRTDNGRTRVQVEPIQGGLDAASRFIERGRAAPYDVVVGDIRRELEEETAHVPDVADIAPGDFTNLHFGGLPRDGKRQKLYQPFFIDVADRSYIDFARSRDNPRAQALWVPPESVPEYITNGKGRWMRDQLLWRLSTR